MRVDLRVKHDIEARRAAGGAPWATLAIALCSPAACRAVSFGYFDKDAPARMRGHKKRGARR